MTDKKAERIQTSFLNGIEKKALVWLAARQPKWMVSDMLTFIGTLGAIVIAAGYILSSQSIHFLWLSSLGFIINWYGDSLDGTLARVRDMQRPIYGYYLDHITVKISTAEPCGGERITAYHNNIGQVSEICVSDVLTVWVWLQTNFFVPCNMWITQQGAGFKAVVISTGSIETVTTEQSR